MPQPILTKYKQGDLGMPYPKKKDKMKNLNLSAHGGEADIDIATKDYPTKKIHMCNLLSGRWQMKKIIRGK